MVSAPPRRPDTHAAITVLSFFFISNVCSILITYLLLISYPYFLRLVSLFLVLIDLSDVKKGYALMDSVRLSVGNQG